MDRPGLMLLLRDFVLVQIFEYRLLVVPSVISQLTDSLLPKDVIVPQIIVIVGLSGARPSSETIIATVCL